MEKPDLVDFPTFSGVFPLFSLLWTQYGHALQIPREADQRPLSGDLGGKTSLDGPDPCCRAGFSAYCNADEEG